MNKKAISIMVGYVLLITISVIMGAIVYKWMKSYVPQETIECPEGVSIFIKELTCDVQGNEYFLNLSLVNNGRFNINGYFIKSAENINSPVAGRDISNNIISGGNAAGGVVRWPSVLEPGQEAPKAVFKLNDNVAFIEVTPIIYKTIENKIKLINCGKAKVRENVICE